MKECECETGVGTSRQTLMYHEMRIFQQLNSPARTAGRNQQATKQE
jgi:hypothetical protein